MAMTHMHSKASVLRERAEYGKSTVVHVSSALKEVKGDESNSNTSSDNSY
jgi:hypothetical protein